MVAQDLVALSGEQILRGRHMLQPGDEVNPCMAFQPCVSEGMRTPLKCLGNTGTGEWGLGFFLNTEWKDTRPLSGLPGAALGKCSIVSSPSDTHGLPSTWREEVNF